jgi:hypothetical protein
MHLVNGQGMPEHSAARACGQVDLDGLKDFVTAARQLQLHGQMTKELHIVAHRMEWGNDELFTLSTNLKLGLLDVSWNRNDDVDWVNLIRIVADFQCSPGQRRRHRHGEIFHPAPNRSSGVADCSFELIARGAALSAHDVRRLLRQPLRFALNIAYSHYGSDGARMVARAIEMGTWGTARGLVVRRPLRPFWRAELTEIHLCDVCSCQKY